VRVGNMGHLKSRLAGLLAGATTLRTFLASHALPSITIVR
jgi:hypothetical protein